MSLTYSDLLYSPAAAERIANRVPLGTRVRILGAKQKVDKMYRGMEGTIIEYGHPASIFDHLVFLPDLDQNRWFRPSEFEIMEDSTDVDSVSQ